MKRDNWPVEEYSMRPVGPPGCCSYCQTPKGQEHKEGCVIRQKTVVVKFEVELLRHVPEHWGKDDIEFGMNESSWCADNIIDELSALAERRGCICEHTNFEFLREATAEDEEAQGIMVAELPS